MKTDPAMPLHVGDYLQDTMALNRAEHGSYILLIMAYWTRGGPLPSDDRSLQYIARCPDSDWERTKSVLAQFFDVSNGSWKHKRIDRELHEAKERKQNILQASQLGVQARRKLGQLPPVNPPDKPAVSQSMRISLEKELDRVESRLEEIRSRAVIVAGDERRYTPGQRQELQILVNRKKQIVAGLGMVA